MTSAYQFGETDRAAERLRILAEVFAPSTRAFLEGLAAVSPPCDVVDLGCGPGHTTRLIAEVFPRACVLGVDSSAHFIALARREPRPSISYAVADATQSLPQGSYDLVYCRYLVTHLSEPRAAISLWADSLRPGGRIAIEENEWIETEVPAFARYLEIVTAMLADAGQKLYVGRELAQSSPPGGLREQSSELVPIPATTRETAAVFVLNLETWRERSFVVANFSTREIDALGADLAQLARGPSLASSIIFGRRRLVYEKLDA